MAEGRERAVNKDARQRKDILEPTEATPQIQAKIDKVFIQPCINVTPSEKNGRFE